jgi:hypothetical protein
MYRFTALILLIFLSNNLKAQTWEFGGSFGGAGYMGDLNQTNPVKISGIAFGGFVKRNFDGYWSAKLNYTYGTINAADSTSSSQQFRDRNLSFTTYLSEISLIGEFNFISYIPEAGKNKFTPYIYIGAAAVNYTPTTLLNGSRYDLRAIETEGQKKPYPTTAFAIPVGAGIKYNFWGKMTLAADLGYRRPNTDYLDDVSGNYPPKTSNRVYNNLADPSGIKTGVYIGTPGTQRGDSNPRDTYFFMQVSLSFTFVTYKCYFEK